MFEAVNTCRQAVWSSGVTCVAIAAFFYSIAAALVRPIDPSTPVFEIVFVRSVFSLIFSLLSAHYGSEDFELRSLFGQLRNVPLLAFRGLAGAAAMDCFYYSIQRLLLAEAVALLFLNPVVTAILAWIFLGESLSCLGILGCLVSLSGMVLVVQPPFLFALGSQVEEWTLERTKGVIAGGTSALLAGFAFMTIRSIGNKERSLTVAVWFHTAALVHSAFLLVFGVMGKPVIPQGYEWLCFVGIAVCSFSANLLISRGLQLESAALGSAINYSQVVYANMIGIIFFHEPPSILGVAGAIFIALGVVALAISTQRKKKSEPKDSTRVLTDAQQDDEEQVGLLDDDFTSSSFARDTNDQQEVRSEAVVQLSNTNNKITG